jgi:hypothetical protein
MTLQEKTLYHQIHPLKLGTDILAQIASGILFWEHQLLWGLLAMLIPPIIASAILVNVLDLRRIRASAVGRYLKRSMTHAMEAVRLAGTVPISCGAWYHAPWLIALGLGMVVFGWLRGLLFPGKGVRDVPPATA